MEKRCMVIFGAVLIVLGIAGMITTQVIMRQPGDFIIVFNFDNLLLTFSYIASAFAFGAGVNMVAVSGTLLGKLRSGGSY